MMSTNICIYIASIGFNLELYRATFCMKRSAIDYLDLDEIENIHKVEIATTKNRPLLM